MCAGTSLFDFCIRVLGYSESQANRRILAMRLVRDVPEAEEGLASGRISLTNAANAQSVFQRSRKLGQSIDKQEILAKLENKASRDAEVILNALDPNHIERRREGFSKIGNGEAELRIVLKEETLAKLERLRGLLVHKKGGDHSRSSDLAINRAR